MRMSRLRSTSGVAALLAVGALMLTVSANGDDRHGDNGRDIFRLMLTPSLRTGPTIHGVAPAVSNWALADGETRLEGNQHGSGSSRSTQRASLGLRLVVQGLVLKTGRNPGAVRSIRASIFCASSTAPAFLSRPAALSGNGDAELRVSIRLRRCLAPVVLVHANGDRTRYIAVSGSGN